jgi:hypothetical protein
MFCVSLILSIHHNPGRNITRYVRYSLAQLSRFVTNTLQLALRPRRYGASLARK